MATLTFRKIDTPDSSAPLPRQGHSSVFHNGCLYVFGGRVQGSGRIYVNDLWKYDTAENKWEEIVAANPTNMPRKRHNHTCIVDSDSIYVFGGQTVSDVYLGDLWRFDLNTRDWTELAGSEPRHSHSALKNQRSMIIFGGRTGFKPAVYSNEILAYDFDKNIWDSLYSTNEKIPTTVAPRLRSYTSIVQCGRLLVVFGGYWWNGKEHYFDDTFGFDLDSNKWVKLSPVGDERIPHKRNRHSAISLPETDDGDYISGMVVFGGNFYLNKKGTDKFFGDAWLFSSIIGESLVSSGSWKKMVLVGDIPCPRGHHTWVKDDQISGRIWMFGGEAKRQRFNDLYEVRVDVPIM